MQIVKEKIFNTNIELFFILNPFIYNHQYKTK